MTNGSCSYLRNTGLRSLHDENGHLGPERTFKLVRDHFYWPYMGTNVEGYCCICSCCIQQKTLGRQAAPMRHLENQESVELACIDFLELDSSEHGNVLEVTDHFIRYVQVFPTTKTTEPNVTKVFVEKFLVHYGLPRYLHSEQVRDFEGKLNQELLNLLGIRKSRTTPYHHQGDPQPKWFNQTLLDMLDTLTAEKKQQWCQHIATVVHTLHYNISLEH